MISRDEFDAEMTEWHRRSNERYAAMNHDMDAMARNLAETRAILLETQDLIKENATRYKH